ncbi:CRISPR-associated endoribonuclease Cas6 [Candidatus Woesearchaeota archaeon]|nr:CRISPR-associated endoribonuclease Cas6 [Candidatus Woesearchaeota archaeon]
MGVRIRLIIKLKALKDCAYDLKYYSKLRGFLFALQRDSKYFNKHDDTGYKFYSFSNIFPPASMKTGNIRTLLVSSPDKDFIYYLYGKISEIMKRSRPVGIGEMHFIIENVDFLRVHVKEQLHLITGTPIILRIPPQRYAEYGITSRRPYEYWRPGYDFGAFLKQLTENLEKKYNQYFKKDIEIDGLFEQFKLKKEVCVHRIEEGREVKTIGSLWEFEFSHLEPLQRKMIELGLESGFGELNSSGFGFMNVVKA